MIFRPFEYHTLSFLLILRKVFDKITWRFADKYGWFDHGAPFLVIDSTLHPVF